MHDLHTLLLGESRVVAALNFTATQRKPTLLSVVPLSHKTAVLGVISQTRC